MEQQQQADENYKIQENSAVKEITADHGGTTEPCGKNQNRSLDITRLFETTQDMIFNLGYRLFRNHDDALDFSQEVYTQAWKKRHTFRFQSKPSTWIYALGLNLGLNRIKRLRLLSFTSIDKIPDTVLSEKNQTSSPSETDVVHQLEKKENENMIYEELDRLEDAYRIPLLLHYYEHLSYKEIAQALQLKQNTLKSYIHRGKKILSSRLKGKIVDSFAKKSDRN